MSVSGAATTSRRSRSLTRPVSFTRLSSGLTPAVSANSTTSREPINSDTENGASYLKDLRRALRITLDKIIEALNGTTREELNLDNDKFQIIAERIRLMETFILGSEGSVLEREMVEELAHRCHETPTKKTRIDPEGPISSEFCPLLKLIDYLTEWREDAVVERVKRVVILEPLPSDSAKVENVLEAEALSADDDLHNDLLSREIAFINEIVIRQKKKAEERLNANKDWCISRRENFPSHVFTVERLMRRLELTSSND